jgi:hypothetical protein
LVWTERERDPGFHTGGTVTDFSLPIFPGAKALYDLRRRLARESRERRDRFVTYLEQLAATLDSMVTTFKKAEEKPTRAGQTLKRTIKGFPAVAFEVYSRSIEEDRTAVQQWVDWLKNLDSVAENIDVVLAAQRSHEISGSRLKEVAWRDFTYEAIRAWVEQLERDIGELEGLLREFRATSPE